MKVFCLGNEYIEEDSYAIKLCRKIEKPGFDFVECQSSDEFLEEVKGHKTAYIIDVVKGLEKVTLITDPEKIKDNLTTSHDFDIGFFISLLKEMGELETIRIIGIPQKELDENTFNKVKKELDKIKK